jgi:hypothetical protein
MKSSVSDASTLQSRQVTPRAEEITVFGVRSPGRTCGQPIGMPDHGGAFHHVEPGGGGSDAGIIRCL